MICLLVDLVTSFIKVNKILLAYIKKIHVLLLHYGLKVMEVSHFVWRKFKATLISIHKAENTSL